MHVLHERCPPCQTSPWLPAERMVRRLKAMGRKNSVNSFKVTCIRMLLICRSRGENGYDIWKAIPEIPKKRAVQRTYACSAYHAFRKEDNGQLH